MGMDRHWPCRCHDWLKHYCVSIFARTRLSCKCGLHKSRCPDAPLCVNGEWGWHSHFLRERQRDYPKRWTVCISRLLVYHSKLQEGRHSSLWGDRSNHWRNRVCKHARQRRNSVRPERIVFGGSRGKLHWVSALYKRGDLSGQRSGEHWPRSADGNLYEWLSYYLRYEFA